jgi:four helix bundle protein
MTEKERFIEELKSRTRKFSVNLIKFCESLKKGHPSSVISYQLVKSATSIGANYRAACRARSQPEFYSKLCIVVEEADETEYWLEIIQESELTCDEAKLLELRTEASELTRILAKAKKSTYTRIK